MFRPAISFEFPANLSSSILFILCVSEASSIRERNGGSRSSKDYAHGWLVLVVPREEYYWLVCSERKVPLAGGW
jgi:hypothetical protein